MKQFSLLLAALFFTLNATLAQTWPTAYSLTAGSYSFTAWDASSAAGTYPANMRFYTLNTVDPTEAATISADYVDSYTATSGTRINGEGTNGVSFINTGSGLLGAAVLALNTTSRKNVTVAWTGRTVLANSRIYTIQLYYRLGDTGGWTAVNSYTKGTDNSSTTLAATVLPAEVENRALVQLQWKYYQDASNGTTSGPRPKLAIDDVSVTSEVSSATTPPVIVLSPASLSSFSAITGTSSSNQSFIVSGSNLTTGITITAPTNFQVSKSPGGGFASSLVLASTGGNVASTTIYTRFSPVTSGEINDAIDIVSGVESKSLPVVGTTITWPSAFNLSGNYSFTAWDASSAAATYPASMRFYNLNTTGDTGPDNEIAEDYMMAYNVGSQTRINGQGTNGISFINTGGNNNANSPTNSYKLGAAVVALNSQGRNSITISWTGKTFLSNNRVYGIQLYYRVGSTGAWTEVSSGGNPVQYVAEAGVTDPAAPSSSPVAPVTLPLDANDQPLVQVMWKYVLDPTSTASGSRAQIGFDDISITSVAAPMPVTWVTGARKNETTATVYWTTYTETHNKNFAVQRSSNAIDFITLGEIESQAKAGISSTQLTYQYTDETPLTGTNYYRIAQRDLDGTTSYSKIYALEFDRFPFAVSLYPNPVSSALNVAINSAKIKEISLLDINGHLLMTKTVNDYSTTVDIQALSQPIFYTQIILENGEKLIRRVVKK